MDMLSLNSRQVLTTGTCLLLTGSDMEETSDQPVPCSNILLWPIPQDYAWL